MANDVLARLKPLAIELMEQLAQVHTLRLQGKHAEAARAEAVAGRLMVDGPLGSWLVSKFRRKGTSLELAEDLAQDVWIKLIKGIYAGTLQVRASALGLLATMAANQLTDHYRRASGTEDDGRAREQGKNEAGEDSGFDVDELPEPVTSDLDLVDCVQRKLAEFAAVSPQRAQLLQWHADGLNMKEIAAIVRDKPVDAVTAKDAGAMRDRLYEARRQAQPYFEECED